MLATVFSAHVEPIAVSRRRLVTRPLASGSDAHWTELLYDDGDTDRICLCAAHGGSVEPGTTELALELATSRPATSCWSCLGYDAAGNAFDRWHPPSSSFDPAEFPLLARIADRGFETVVSLHGLAEDAVLVGGAIDGTAKRWVADRLNQRLSVSVEVVADGPYGGVSPDNFVNWLAAGRGGLQLELGATARGPRASTVRTVLDDWLENERL